MINDFKFKFYLLQRKFLAHKVILKLKQYLQNYPIIYKFFYLIGIALISLSTIAYAILLIIPFFSISIEQKSLWISSLFIFGEITWWIGLLFCGKQLINRMKTYFNPKTWYNYLKSK